MANVKRASCSNRLVFWASVFCLIVSSTWNTVAAQSELTAGQEDSRAGLSIETMTVSPYARAVPGGVLTLRCIVRNAGKQSAVGYLVGRVVGQSGEEDRRRIELTAKESKSYEIQLRLAKSLAKPTIDIVVTLNVMDGDREVMVQQGDEPVAQTLTLQVPKETNITAILLDAEPPAANYWQWPETKAHATYELIVGSRVDASLTRRCIGLDQEPLPLNLADWKFINLLAIADQRVFEDAANISVMQQFLQNGGRIWIMLDRIDTKAIGDLLSVNQQIETIGTVDLNRFEVEVPGSGFAVQDRTVDRDDHLLMKRVMQQGGEVTHLVGGWPAAIWMPVGRGKLFLTTLSSVGWIEPRRVNKSSDPMEQSAYTLPSWAGFANVIHYPKPQLALNLSEEKYPIDRIGNPVVSRSLVAFILLAFCVCLIGFGIWHVFGSGMNQLGIVVPTLALAASVPLIVAASLQRREIPSMVSALQVVHIASNGALLREAAAVYSNDSHSMELSGKGDGLAIPASEIETGIRTVTRDDFHRWRMSNTAWPTGTWRYNSQISMPEVSFVVEAQLTSQGLSIELPKELPSPIEDPIVIMVAGAPSLGKWINGKSRLIVDGELPAEGERWTTDTILSEEQRRRAELYAKLFETTHESQLPLRTLCGWSDLWKQSPEWNANYERRGTALVTMPIRLAIPKTGSPIRIPYPLIQIEHAQKGRASTVFRQDIGQFIQEAVLKTDTELAFVLPPETLPIEAQSLAIDWDIKAPNRQVRLVCVCDEGPIVLVALNEPSIPWRGTIDNPRVLAQLREGRIVLRIEISDENKFAESQDRFVSWRIKHLRLSVEGRTLPKHNLVPSPQP